MFFVPDVAASVGRDMHQHYGLLQQVIVKRWVACLHWIPDETLVIWQTVIWQNIWGKHFVKFACRDCNVQTNSVLHTDDAAQTIATGCLHQIFTSTMTLQVAPLQLQGMIVCWPAGSALLSAMPQIICFAASAQATSCRRTSVTRSLKGMSDSAPRMDTRLAIVGGSVSNINLSGSPHVNMHVNTAVTNA